MTDPQRNRSIKLITNMFRRQKLKLETKKNKKSSNNDVLGGVYFTATSSSSTSTTTTNQLPKVLVKQDSSRSWSTVDTSFSSGSDSDCDNSTTTQSSSWESSGSPSHHTGSPLLVRSAVSQRHLGSLHLSDEEVLGRILIKSRKLPSAKNGYFASNHVMINNERTKRTMAPLKRSPDMDEIAREHASHMATQQSLFHADSVDLEDCLAGAKKNRIGANVGRGSSVSAIHKFMMESSVSDKNNITDRRFVFMGVGTAKASDGTLYVCQIFSD